MVFLINLQFSWKRWEIRDLVLCVVNHDKVILKPVPCFMANINSKLHWAQEIMLPRLFPYSFHLREQIWQKQNVHAAEVTHFKYTQVGLGFLFFVRLKSEEGKWIRKCIMPAGKKFLLASVKRDCYINNRELLTLYLNPESSAERWEDVKS